MNYEPAFIKQMKKKEGYAKHKKIGEGGWPDFMILYKNHKRVELYEVKGRAKAYGPTISMFEPSQIKWFKNFGNLPYVHVAFYGMEKKWRLYRFNGDRFLFSKYL